MNLQVGPKPHTLLESLENPFKGTLKGTLVATHEPPSRVSDLGLTLSALRIAAPQTPGRGLGFRV